MAFKSLFLEWVTVVWPLQLLALPLPLLAKIGAQDIEEQPEAIANETSNLHIIERLCSVCMCVRVCVRACVCVCVHACVCITYAIPKQAKVQTNRNAHAICCCSILGKVWC